jgi:hypothetical protein
MTRSILLSFRHALCGLLALTDHAASREMALLGICIADIHMAEARWQKERATKVQAVPA